MKAFRHVHFKEAEKGTANHNNHAAYIKVNNVAVNDHEDCSNNANGLSDMGSTKPMSFASILQDKSPKKTVKISELHNNEIFEGTDLAIPLVAIKEVSIPFVNILYGYFIGKRLAFLIVENYVKNTCAKFSIERVMLQNGFFFFQFSTRDCMEKVIESSLWHIRLVPLILNVWTPNSKLKKNEIISAHVWIKLHNIPIVVGQNTYARALIEVSSGNALLESLIVAIPLANGMGNTMETIKIEYEWQPPRRATCKIFDHTDDKCPKKVKLAAPTQVTNEGFVEVTRKNGKGEASSPQLNNNTEAPATRPDFTSTVSSLAESNISDSEEVEKVFVVEDIGLNKGWIKSTNGNKGQALPLSRFLMYSVVPWIIRGMNQSLKQNEHYVRGRPWCLLGDFNAALNLKDKSVGSSNIDIAMRDFKDCVEEIEVTDVSHSVLKFTWNQKPKGEDDFLKKIDKIMVNMEFNDTFIRAHAIF
ncbi:zinc knuckle CX2CX4HX4C containing protein [Tanacetum coccineum]